MKVLIACEESQIVCKEFRKLGHEAYSCDILPPSGGHPEWHIQDDVLNHLDKGWDLMIAHPSCQFLTITGNKWFYHPDDFELPADQRRPHPRFPERRAQQYDAVEFFMKLYEADIPRIAIENPVGIMSTVFRKPDQYIQPYWFGDAHSKKTGLWLRNLPKLVPTNMVEPEWYVYKDGRKDPKWHVDTLKLPAAERTCMRSKTFKGIAEAFANQWGNL
jgi:hypothetical protein